ncbi:alpha/beta fold hydrolase [Alishewanella sp. HL-SH06]|uniref:alpha/beta fold hydrolase n=1 Tax=Alishewanella sp. HL-SH06 TaxID=3461144 RepID=UPI0040415F29
MADVTFNPIQPLTTEQQLTKHWLDTLLPFWRQMQHGQFAGVAGVPIHYSYHLTPGAHTAWVISSGRIETAIKYSELMLELTTAGYSVFILDHRGQGRSGRMLPDSQLGYVADFADYQHDLESFLRQVVKPAAHQKHVLLAHSMGAAIAAGLITQPPWQEWQSFFCAAILCSPMFGIYTGMVPSNVAEPLALLYCQLRRWWQPNAPRYFPMQLAYKDKAFAHNELTQSQARYQALRHCYQTEPQLQLGGVTCTWLHQAILAMKRLRCSAHHCQTPVLLLQAGADQVVANRAQLAWFKQLPKALPHSFKIIEGAKHELLMEQDNLRQQALVHINQFLQQLPTFANKALK